MLQPRRSILAVLALHLATATSPSAALLVCMSADGRASIEFAAPGTVHCSDPDCEPGAASADEHSCCDIPVLSPGQAIARSSPAAVAPPPALLGAATAAAACTMATGVAPVATSLAPPPTARALRSVILTL